MSVALKAHAQTRASVQRGVVQLDPGELNTPVSLSGDWALWPGVFISDVIQSPNDWVENAPTYVMVPGSMDREALTLHGADILPYGTYAIRIDGLDDFARRYLELRSGDIGFASRIHIVGSRWERLAREDLVGRVSKSRQEEMGDLGTKFFEINTQDQVSVFILVEFSFHEHRLGGFHSTPKLFEAPAGTIERLREFGADAAMSGILFIFACFHFVLFSRRRQDTPSLWFGLFCLSMGARLLPMSEIYSLFFTSELSIQRAVAIEYAGMSLGGVFGLCFILALVPGNFYRLCVFALCGVGTILSGFAMLSGTLGLTSALRAFQIYIIIVLVTITLHLFGQIRNSINARYALVGIGLLSVAVINDLLHANGLIETDYIVPLSVVLFVLVQSGLIGRNHARVFAERDRAQEELLQNYQKLDEELLKRDSLLKKNNALRQENLAAVEQLVAADKLATMGTVVAGVAHDIANPTGLISNTNATVREGLHELQEFLEQLIGEPEDDESEEVLGEFRTKFASLHERLDRIGMGAERIETINLAIRNQARRDGFEKGVFLGPIIDECTVILAQRLKDIRLEVDCDSAISMDCKRSEIGQILMNLLSNAADAIRGSDVGERSFIRVRVESFLDEAGRPFIRLCVSDSGPGIAAELVD
ncbi:MAG: 7TM diverse intracellular signaling domain-containing protein, partial [Myxococcota bacterium]|nr:7TM diverse intracellular signaling domain-containing protein [Myxococcota bacterium]